MRKARFVTQNPRWRDSTQAFKDSAMTHFVCFAVRNSKAVRLTSYTARHQNLLYSICVIPFWPFLMHIPTFGEKTKAFYARDRKKAKAKKGRFFAFASIFRVFILYILSLVPSFSQVLSRLSFSRLVFLFLFQFGPFPRSKSQFRSKLTVSIYVPIALDKG